MYNEEQDSWSLSPAYDMTYSNTYYGEHTTTVNGNGVSPSRKDLLEVGFQAGLTKKKCNDMIEEIEGCVNDMLGEYLERK